jgi:hypothetical protein
VLHHHDDPVAGPDGLREDGCAGVLSGLVRRFDHDDARLGEQ